MRHKTNTRSSLFLMELIIAILFFSLASAVCLRMFAKSHQLSTDASVMNQTVNTTANVAELIKYDLENGTRTLAEEYPDADIIKNNTVTTDSTNTNVANTDAAKANTANTDAVNTNTSDMYSGSVIYFDKNWAACSDEQAEYKLTIQAQDSSATLRKYVLSMYSLSEKAADSDNTAVSDNGNLIYELPLSIHIAREVTAHE